MARRSLSQFATLKTEGALLTPGLLARFTGGEAKDLPGLAPADYHLGSGETLNDAIARAWNRLLGLWKSFLAARAAAPADDPLTGVTREKWLLPLFQELGYGRLQAAKVARIDDRDFPISHAWNRVPIHLVGAGVSLDVRTKGVAGAAKTTPHGLVQDFLNRSETELWGFVSNGLLFRLLRDNASLVRQSYVEFDLERMMDGEVYSDFVLLFLLAHESRVEGEKPEECWLERWVKAGAEQGTRALDRLRDGVQKAIESLGRGFLVDPANTALKARLRTGELSSQDYYRELLRLVYRLLFLFVAEDRDLLHPPETDDATRARFRDWYGTARLRRMAQALRGSRHPDLWRTLRHVMAALGSTGSAGLGLAPLGGFLWSDEACPNLVAADISNAHLLEAVRALGFIEDDGVLMPIDHRNRGAEEMGSIYESLLELHPRLHMEAGTFELKTAAGHERKTTGSYYTPSSLIHRLLDSALDPILAEAAKKPTREEAERAILALKVLDPACGSGHFLIAAAHRIARRLAAVRSGDEEPSPESYRRALRDVIGRCIYGVDKNPTALELCKVGLWMESIVPGMPLGFLDHHLQVGNSLLGATPFLVSKGIPDSAFEPIAGDDKPTCNETRRRNRDERKGQLPLSYIVKETGPAIDFAKAMASVEAVDDRSLAGVREKEERFAALAGSPDYRRSLIEADSWCAAFVWTKAPGASVLTEHLFRSIRKGGAVAPEIEREIDRLRTQYGFFHWHLAFPGVFAPEAAPSETPGWSGGFDVVLGNPPWERLKLQEKEWFAERSPKIADAPNKAAREKLIEALRTEDPPLFAAFGEAARAAEGESILVRNTGRFPLCGRGDVNTYAIFAEAMRSFIGPRGRVGCILPSGIATDDTTKFYFQDIVEREALVSLFDFENRSGLFPAVDARQKFCLLTLTGRGSRSPSATFSFFAHAVSDLADPDRRFTLTRDDIALINPNTKTCPIFRTRRDAEITKAIYRRVPILLREGPPEENPWGVRFMAMLHMSNDSGLFRTRPELEGEGYRLDGNRFVREGRPTYLPLYEAKMIHHFNHRFGDYADQPEGSENTSLPDVPPERLADARYAPLPRYWVPEPEVESRLRARDWPRGWLLGWRDITNATNERTVIASVLPRVGVGNNLPLMILDSAASPAAVFLAANLSAFALDFVARQKVGGTHLNFFIYEQLPVLPPDAYSAPCPWSPGESVADWLRPRVLELVHTAHEIDPFARDLGHEGPPFRWDEERRFHLRAEIDAAFFHLYGLSRDNAAYILDTFPIVRRNDESRFGEYRTRRVILERFDELAGSPAVAHSYIGARRA